MNHLKSGLHLLKSFLQKKTRRKILAKIRSRWGKEIIRYRDYDLIAKYHQLVVAAKHQTQIDDKTWSDLNMEAIFGILHKC